MGLSGFPTFIQVTLGSAWAGVNGLDPSDTIELEQVSSGVYSEDGTDTPNTSTNRIKIVFTSAGIADQVNVYGAATTGWDSAAAVDASFSPTDSTYNFLDLFSASSLSASLKTPWMSGTGDYNPNVFSDLASYTPPTSTTPEPPLIELVPVTPTVAKVATPSAAVVDVIPKTPYYAGPPPTVTTCSPVVVDVVPVAPTLIKTVAPDAVVIDITAPQPTAFRTVVTPSPVVIDVVPVLPKYVGGPPITRSMSPVVIDLIPVVPAVRKRLYGSMSGRYRVFNDAEYRFFRSNSAVPQEDDTPFATASSLPDTPTTTFADGTWRVSAAYFNGCLQSGFYPIENGKTYATIVISSGTEQNPPPGPHILDVRQVTDGVVQIRGMYVIPDNTETYAWAIAYTTNGSTPAEDSPTITQSMGTGNVDYLVYNLPSQAAGTTVKVRVQVRRYDDPAWTYSDDSEVHTVVVDSDPGEVTSADKMVGRLDR